MATRADYRTALNHKLLALEDGGYGDFEYEQSDLDLFLEFAVARLFPSVYKRLSEDALTITAYGTGTLGYVSPQFPERVYLIEDAAELAPVHGWKLRPTRIVGIDTCQLTGTSVNVYYYDAYALPDDDVTPTGIGDVYTPLIVLAALIEALEARQDTGVRGEPPPTGVFQETQLIDRLTPRFERLKEELAMSLPAVNV